MEIAVIDNFFPDELAGSLLNEVDDYAWKFTRSDNVEDVYWTKQVYGVDYLANRLAPSFLKYFTEPTVQKLWEYFSSKFNVSTERLESCYLNLLTHGVEAHQHIDAAEDEAITVICYVCKNWNSYWSGATNFYDGKFINNPADNLFYSNEICKSVLPRNNRIVVFRSNIIHSVTPLSKSFKGQRITLMFKIRNIKYKELINAT